MIVRSFLDSNVLVYTDDVDSPAKQRSALDLAKAAISDGWGVVSTQVLQEYFAVTTRKLGVSPDVARDKIEIFSRPKISTLARAMSAGKPSFRVTTEKYSSNT